MLRISFKDKSHVSLEVKNRNQTNKPIWAGTRAKMMKEITSHSRGFDGQVVGEYMSAIDLYLIVNSKLSFFEPTVVEGKDLIEKVKEILPPGSVP